MSMENRLTLIRIQIEQVESKSELKILEHKVAQTKEKLDELMDQCNTLHTEIDIKMDNYED